MREGCVLQANPSAKTPFVTFCYATAEASRAGGLSALRDAHSKVA